MGPTDQPTLYIFGFLLFQTCTAFESQDYVKWFRSWSSSSSFPAAEVSCDWTLPDAGIFVKNLTVVCPKDCLDHVHCTNVKGSGPYTVHSPICLAAIHAGVITAEKGGAVDVSVSKPSAPFFGSARNGVNSLPTISDFGAITLAKSTTSCNQPPTTAKPTCECCGSALVDLVFVLDSSASVGAKDFKTGVDFIKELTSLFSISKTDTRVGLLTFNSYPATRFKLYRYQTKKEVLKAMDAVSYHQGGTYIGKALYKVSKDMIFRIDPDVERIVVVMSDGNSFDDVKKPVAVLSSKRVKMLSLGIGRSRQLGAKTLLEIANGVKENTYSIESYSDLKNYFVSISQRLAYMIKCPSAYDRR